MRRCMPEDKRAAAPHKAIALIISFAMLATTFSMGVAFADEKTETSGEDVNTNYAEQDAGMQPGNEDVSVYSDADGEFTDPGILPEEEAVNADGGFDEDFADGSEEPVVEDTDAVENDPEEEGMMEAAGVTKKAQTIRVVIALNKTKRVLLKPDAFGKYTLYSSISKLRGYKNIKVLISNPADSKVSYTKQKVASNTGGSFLETKLIGSTINDTGKLKAMSEAVEAAGGEMDEAQPILDETDGEGTDPVDVEEPPAVEDPDPPQEEPAIDPEAVQVTEISVKVNGTGEATISFKAKSSDYHKAASGKILIRQKRPTTEINRTAKTRMKTGHPKTIPKKYKEKYFKIVKDGDNEKAVYKHKTVTKPFEIKRASGISESGYRANQGGGTDGTYSYNALCKKGSKTYVKIVKTRLSDMKVVKVSKDLKLNHANDITYDPENKRLVVTHNDVKRKRVTFVNPKTLKSMGYKDIKVPETLKGATKGQMSNVKGFASVTYMTGGKYVGYYIAVISGNHNFLVLDQNFKPVEYITVDKKIKGSQVYYQGADNIGDKLYIAVYSKAKSRRDYIVGYDMDGNFLGKIKLLKGYETENIFHVGDKQYMTLYKMVKKVWYTPKVVEKKIKLTKEEREKAKPNKKGKKPKYKTVKRIVKEKHTKVVKRSYIFKMDKVTL